MRLRGMGDKRKGRSRARNDHARIILHGQHQLIGALAILMVSKIRYSSFKTAGSGRQSYIILLVLAATAMFVFLYSQYALLTIAGIYVSHGVIWWIARSISAKLRPSSTDI